MLKYILPVLGGHIKNNYNPPSAKDERVLQDVVAWQPYLRSNMLDQLLGGEVISKWLDALWIWLTAPEANLVEIANWYNWWKEWFGSHSVGDMTSIKEGMEQALYMMDQAEQLGADVQFRYLRSSIRQKSKLNMNLGRLAKPTKRSLNNTERPKSSKKTSNAKPTMGHPSEVSFRSIVEEEAAMADLLFQPANRSHPSNGLPLFRVSKADKKAGGVLLFIKDDVVWAAEGGDWHPVGISELMQKAKGG